MVERYDADVVFVPMERTSIDHSWDTSDQIRAKISQRLPQLKHRAAQTNEFLVSLLRK